MAVTSYFQLGSVRNETGEVLEVVVEKEQLEACWEKFVQADEAFRRNPPATEKYPKGPFLRAIWAILNSVHLFDLAQSPEEYFSSHQKVSLGEKFTYVASVFSVGEAFSEADKIWKAVSPLLLKKKISKKEQLSILNRGMKLCEIDQRFLELYLALGRAQKELGHVIN